MRTTNKNIEKRTETFEFVQKNIALDPPDNVNLTLFLLQKNQGGEMYGM